MLGSLLLTILFSVNSQTTYYVSIMNGVNNSECGQKDSPCDTINQVLDNYPGESYVVSISLGEYMLTKISLEQSAKVIFQGGGTEDTNIKTTDMWNSTTLILHSPSSGFEFHDLSLFINRSVRGNFTLLNSKDNSVGFYNVAVTCGNNLLTVVGLTGGVVVMSNVTFTLGFGYAILKNNIVEGTDTSINITGCTFVDILNSMSGLVFLTGPGVMEMVLDKTSFSNITTAVHCIAVDVIDANSKVTVTNNVFNLTQNNESAITLGLSQYKYVIAVRNTTFINCTSFEWFSGGLGINRSDTSVVDNSVTLDTLRFESCTGPYAGALYVGYNSFVLLRSSFIGNKGRVENISASDIFFAVPSASAGFTYSIVSSHSSSDSDSDSDQKKAVMWTDDTNSTTDISNSFNNAAAAKKKKPVITIVIIVVAVVVVLVVVGVVIGLIVVRKRKNARPADAAAAAGVEYQKY